jgi:hypothetical protein
MSPAEKQALALRDLAVIVAKAKDAITPTEGAAPDQSIYQDARLRIVYRSTTPQALEVFRRGDLDLKVLSVIWNGEEAVVVVHRTGSWETSLRRLAKGCV